VSDEQAIGGSLEVPDAGRDGAKGGQRDKEAKQTEKQRRLLSGAESIA
jgi:hypothetical protein